LEGALSKDPRRFVLSWINDVYSDSFIEKSGPQLLERLVSIYSNGFDFKSAAYLLKSFLKMAEEPLTPKLRGIDKPTLIIAAEKDRVKPPKYSEIIAKNITNSTYVVINDAGHAVVIEKPTIINYLIMGFIRSHPLSTT
jgi:pimeloyl-ACP methyl ester carboxylesterase